MLSSLAKLTQFFHTSPPLDCQSLCNLTNDFIRSRDGSNCTHSCLPFGCVASNCDALKSFLDSKSFEPSHAIGVAQLTQGRVFADGVVISRDGRSLARDCAPDFRRPFDEHWLLDVPKLRRPKHVTGRLLVVACHAANNYYHWLLEELPRLLLAHELTKFDKTLLTENAFTESVLRCLEIDVPRVPVSAISHYWADQLIVPTYLAPTGFQSPKTVQLLSGFARRYAPEDDQIRSEKIYVSRRLAKRRTVKNESRLMDELQRRGFQEVILESLTLQEQMRIFRAARFVVAPHGAGLANLAFCQPGSKVIELFNNGYVHHCYAQLAGLVGMKYTGLCSDPDGPVGHGVGESQQEICVPVEEVLRWVDREAACE